MLRHISIIVLLGAIMALPLGCVKNKQKTLDELLPEKTQAEMLESQGDKLYREGQAEQAVVFYERARHEGAPEYRIAYKSGMAMMMLKKLPVALELFQEAAEGDEKYRARAYQASGFAAFGLGKAEQSEIYLRKALEENPKLVESHNLLGVLLNNRNMPQAALEEFQAAMRLSGGSPDVFNNIGISYLKLDKYEEAAKAFVQSLSLKENGRTWNNLGLSLCKLGRFDRALSAFEQAGPKAGAYNNIAMCYQEAGKTTEAAEYFSKARELDPGSIAVEGAEIDIEQTTGTPLDQAEADVSGEHIAKAGHETFLLKERVPLDEKGLPAGNAVADASEADMSKSQDYASSGVLPAPSDSKTSTFAAAVKKGTSVEKTSGPSTGRLPVAAVRPMPLSNAPSSDTKSAPEKIAEAGTTTKAKEMAALAPPKIKSTPLEPASETPSPAENLPEPLPEPATPEPTKEPVKPAPTTPTPDRNEPLDPQASSTPATAQKLVQTALATGSTSTDAGSAMAVKTTSSTPSGGPIAITDYTIVDTPDVFVLRLMTAQPLGEARAFDNNDPVGMVVDFDGVYTKPPKIKLKATGGLVKAVRMWAHPDKLRVVFDFGPSVGATPPSLSLHPLSDGTEIRLTRSSKS